MLLPLTLIVKILRIQPKGVLHIGAHEAEESRTYQELGWDNVIWLDAQESLVNKLIDLLPINNSIYHAAVWDVDNELLELKVASNSQSTSLLNFGTHEKNYPNISFNSIEIVKTSRIDTMFENLSSNNFVNLDIQGAEGRALRGFGKLLSNIDYLYTEVNSEEVYEDCDLVGDLDDLLLPFGLVRVVTRWVPSKGWGDALYLRNPVRWRMIILKICLFPSGLAFRINEYWHLLFNKIKFVINRND